MADAIISKAPQRRAVAPLNGAETMPELSQMTHKELIQEFVNLYESLDPDQQPQMLQVATVLANPDPAIRAAGRKTLQMEPEVQS